MWSSSSTPSRGFTLIELLVVIAIIGVLMGGLGFALRGGDGVAGMRSGQGQLTSLVLAARTQATINNAPARLIFFNDPSDLDNYLRFATVVVRQPDGTWRTVNQGVSLPRGVYFTPPIHRGVSVDWLTGSGDSVPSSHTRVAETGNAFMTFSGGNPPSSRNLAASDSSSSSAPWFFIEFRPNGLLDAPAPAEVGGTSPFVQIVLATGQPNPASPSSPVRFINPNNLLGVHVSVLGAAFAINSPEALYPDSDPRI